MKLSLLIRHSKPKRSIRGRPISTNQPPSSVYNYRSSRNESARKYDRGEDQKKLSKFPSRLFGKIFFLVSVLVCLVYLLILTPNSKLETRGQSIIDRPEGAYQAAVDRHLKESIFNYSKITFDGGQLASQIKAEFPEISEANVALPLFNRQPKVNVTFAEPTVKLKAFGNDNFILDENGRALALESHVSSSLNLNNLTTINDTSDQKIELGKTVLTQQQLEFIKQTVAYANQKKFPVETINLTGGASQLDVAYSGTDYLVKYSFFADPRLSSGAYFALREQLEKDMPKQYIDLRIPERAYTK